MRTIVLSVENMKEVESILGPMIAGEARFSQSEFFDPNHPHIGDWEHEETRVISRVQHHWMFEQHQETGERHHSDKQGNETLFRLHCHATSSEILHAGDILYVIDSRMVVIERKDAMAITHGKFIKITMVKKFEDLTNQEVTDAAWLEIKMDRMQAELWLWNSEQEEREEEREREQEEFRLSTLDQDELWEEVEAFNIAGQPDPESYSHRGYEPSAFGIF